MYNPFDEPIGVNIAKKTKVDVSELLNRTCTIPKDTLLLRVSSDTDYHNKMFFAFQFGGVTSAFTYIEDTNREIQLWKTIDDIEVPYRIIDINTLTGKINGALEVFYHEYFKEWEFAHKFKQYSHPNRKKFLSFLKERGDIGWVSSVEDTSYSELFLMNSIDDKKKKIEFQRVVSPSEDYSSFDSFSNIIINE